MAVLMCVFCVSCKQSQPILLSAAVAAAHVSCKLSPQALPAAAAAAGVSCKQAVAVVQRAIRGEAPEAFMAGLGFGPLLLIKAFPVKMSGGRCFGHQGLDLGLKV